jgi:hypothetical protein
MIILTIAVVNDFIIDIHIADSAIKNAKEALGLHIWGMEQK